MASALTPVHSRIDVPLTEEFVDEYTYGRFAFLQGQTTNTVMGNTEGPGYNWGLYTQNHVDIRTFVPNDSQYPENWTYTTTGSVESFQLGPEPYLNNWNAMVTSTLGVTSYVSTTAKSVDLTQFGDDANVTVALPNFQSVYIDPTTSFLEVSSDGFTTFSTVDFSMSNSTFGQDVDCTAIWPVSLLRSQNNGTDLTQITSVRFRFQTYDEAVLMMCNLRLIGPDWIATNVDIDNWNGAMRQCIPLNGARGVFPVAPNQQLGTLWYVAPTTGEDDPQPINSTIGVLFNTGSMLFSNNFSVSMRAVGGDDVSQLTLNGQPQALLEGPQPSLSTSAKLPREVADLEGMSMSQMSSQNVFNLSARQEFIAQEWINFALVWGSGISSISVSRSDRSDTGSGYSWTGSAANAITHLSPNTFYLCLVSISETTARMQVLNVDQDDYSIVTPWNVGVVFDTGPLPDSYIFPRRRGRIGFSTNLLDGDAQIRSVRPHALTYAEWRSVPMQSNTPVTGARLYASYAPHEQLWSSWSACPGQYGATPLLDPDTSRTTSGSSTKVTIQQGAAINQGIISNVLTPPDNALAGIIDWRNSQIYFDVWFPETGLQNPLSAYLLSQDGAQIPLTLPAIAPGQWQTITCFPPSIPPQYLSVMQSGRYQLVLIYEGTQPLSFWVDNVKVIERTVTWDARANPTDLWTTFGDLISSDDAGVLFNKGTQLQVRAVAHRQDDVILAPPQIIPRYGALGNLVWPENQTADPYSAIVPTVTISGSTHGAPVTFDASNSLAYPGIATGKVANLTNPQFANNFNNLIINGDFSQGLIYWSASGTNTLTLISSAGQNTCQCTYQNSLTGLLQYSPGSWPTIKDGGLVYTMVAQVYIPNTWTGGPVRIANTPADSTWLAQVTSNNALVNQWQTIWTIYYFPTAGGTGFSVDSGLPPYLATTSATAGQSIFADNVAYFIGDGRKALSNFVWNFGDGTVGAGAKVAHTYAQAGQYNVSCVMTDTYGTSTIYSTIVSMT